MQQSTHTLASAQTIRDAMRTSGLAMATELDRRKFQWVLRTSHE